MDERSFVRKSRRAGKPGAQYRWADQTLDRDEQYRLRREALLRTAARAFNETSYHTTSLDELARRLNVTKPTLYYYIKDKDDILFECQRIGFEYIKGALSEAETGSEPGGAKLARFLSRFAELMTTDFGACLVRTGLKPLKPESRRKLAVFAEQLDHTLLNLISTGIKDRSIRPCDPKLMAYAIFGGFNGIAHWYRADGPLDPKQISSAFIDLFLRGLAPDSPSPARARTLGRAPRPSPHLAARSPQ